MGVEKVEGERWTGTMEAKGDVRVRLAGNECEDELEQAGDKG